jgi:hypothetical protein
MIVRYDGAADGCRGEDGEEEEALDQFVEEEMRLAESIAANHTCLDGRESLTYNLPV